MLMRVCPGERLLFRLEKTIDHERIALCAHERMTTFLALERPTRTYAKIIDYGPGYWLWLTSGGLVIVTGAIGLVKQK
jgi:hypothetical protein